MTAISGEKTALRSKVKTGGVRWSILAMLFIVTTVNYADRSTLSIAGDAIQKTLGINAVTMGYLFSAFGWTYLISQIPSGYLLDRFGAKKVYGCAIVLWSAFTMAQGAIGNFSAATAVGLLQEGVSQVQHGQLSRQSGSVKYQSSTSRRTTASDKPTMNSENPLAITHTRPSMNATRIAHVIFRQ